MFDSTDVQDGAPVQAQGNYHLDEDEQLIGNCRVTER